MSDTVKEIIIDVALWYVGGYIGSLGKAGGFAARLGQAVQAIALTRAIGFIAASIQDKPRKLQAGIQDEYTGTVEPRRLIYGTALVGGMNVIPPWTSGAQNDYMHQVLAIAGRQINAIPTVYLNQEPVNAAAIGAITGAATDGLATTSTYQNKIWIRRYLGTSTQTVDYILNQAFPTQWDSNHRGRGVPYLALQYKFDSTIYRTGKPLVRPLVEGHLIYDPRKDSTNGGSGSHRVDTDSTWEYVGNPALCTADFIRDSQLGLGESTDRVDWVTCAASASICDEDVAIPPGPSDTEKRYRCSVVLDCTAPFEENLKLLVETMRGYVIYSGGKWRIYAGAWRTPDFTLTDDDVIGSVEFRTAIPYKDRWNAVRGQYVEPALLYQPDEYPAIRNSSDEADDGEGPVWREMNAAGVTSKYQAQRDAIVLQRMSRRKRRLVVECGLSAFKIRPGDTGTIALAMWDLAAMSVRCTSWAFSPEGRVSLTLDEADAADWADPARVDYTTPATTVGVAPGAMIPTPPTTLTIIGGPDSITASWAASSNAIPGTLYQLHEHSASTPFSSAVAVGPETPQLSITIPRTSTAARFFWVSARFPTNGQTSLAAMADAVGVSGAALSITTGFRINVAPTSVYTSGPDATQESAPVTVTPVNPAGSVTYSWARVSGSTLISALSASSATTAFEAAGMSNNTEYWAEFEVTADDGVTTKTATVVVGFLRGDLPP